MSGKRYKGYYLAARALCETGVRACFAPTPAPRETGFHFAISETEGLTLHTLTSASAAAYAALAAAQTDGEAFVALILPGGNGRLPLDAHTM